MNRDGESETALRERIRAFLVANCKPMDPDWDPPSGVLDETSDPEQPLKEALRYQRLLAGAGLAGLDVPSRYGGAGLDASAYLIFAEEAGAFSVPSTLPLTNGLNLAVPTLLRHGSEEQRESMIRPTLCADLVWCQLFSEPDAGSDLASLRTSARKDGDGYVVSGQKVWSSFAQHATHGLLMARTGDPESRHRGLSLFALPMHSPGIEVRPLREITGGTHFCEVFLNEVVVSKDAMIGPPGQGWAVAMFTLGTERRAPAVRPGRPRWRRLVDIASAGGRSLSDADRARIINVYVAERVVQWLNVGLEASAERAGWGAAAGSLVKLSKTLLEQKASLLGAEILGARSVARSDSDKMAAGVAHWVVAARASSLGAGTDEIQRNLIGERLLGLPVEPRPGR